MSARSESKKIHSFVAGPAVAPPAPVVAPAPPPAPAAAPVVAPAPLRREDGRNLALFSVPSRSRRSFFDEARAHTKTHIAGPS